MVKIKLVLSVRVDIMLTREQFILDVQVPDDKQTGGLNRMWRAALDEADKIVRRERPGQHFRLSWPF